MLLLYSGPLVVTTSAARHNENANTSIDGAGLYGSLNQQVSY